SVGGGRMAQCTATRYPLPAMSPGCGPRSRGGRSLLLYFRATGIAPQRWTVAGGPVERTAPCSPGKRSAPGAGTDTRMKDPGRTGEPGQSRPTYECALRLFPGCGLRPRLRLLLRPCPGHVPKEAGALGADAWPSALRCNTRGFKLCARACKPRLQAGD